MAMMTLEMKTNPKTLCKPEFLGVYAFIISAILLIIQTLTWFRMVKVRFDNKMKHNKKVSFTTI